MHQGHLPSTGSGSIKRSFVSTRDKHRACIQKTSKTSTTKNTAPNKRKILQEHIKGEARSYARRTPEALETELRLKRHSYRKIYIIAEKKTINLIYFICKNTCKGCIIIN